MSGAFIRCLGLCLFLDIIISFNLNTNPICRCQQTRHIRIMETESQANEGHIASRDISGISAYIIIPWRTVGLDNL